DLVTGVQTCALPIYSAGQIASAPRTKKLLYRSFSSSMMVRQSRRFNDGKPMKQKADERLLRRFGLLQATALNMSNMIGVGPFIKIGRASCRERCSGR